MAIDLRKTTESDLNFVLETEQSAENRVFVSVWKRAQHLAALTDEDLLHLIIENSNSERIGYVILAGLTNENQNIEFRRIAVAQKNRGYGKQTLREIKRIAFEELNANRLWLDVKEYNERARHLYKTEGFTVEGILRECLKTENGFESLVVMSMLHREFKGNKNENFNCYIR